jgi:branched-chain amino acid transport system permease protein
MRLDARTLAGYAALAAAGLLGPLVLPAYTTQLAFLWVMVVFALTWDVLGGQMGYNSFGNVVYFGIGMYVCAIVQVAPFTDLAEYTSAYGTQDIGLTHLQYYAGLAAGCAVAALVAVAVAFVLGSGILGLRGHYFAICTLGLGIAAGEIAAGIDIIGAGSGMVTPLYPGDIDDRNRFFYYLCFALTIVTFLTLRRLYAGRFGLAINAIRDDEDKAEAMGLHTTRYKTVAWCIAAVFLAICGGFVGNMIGFIDPTDVAFAGATYGVWMVLMAILGGKGTIWGPVLGAVIFHVSQELFWTYLLGWQRVALGLSIVLIVIFFPQGIIGWLRQRFPERFGPRIEAASDQAREPAQ